MGRINKRIMKASKNGNSKRCIISNKLISNKDVVITDYAVDYVKGLGYEVTPIRIPMPIKAVVVIILIFSFMFSFASIRADPYNNCSIYGTCKPTGNIINNISIGNATYNNTYINYTSNLTNNITTVNNITNNLTQNNSYYFNTSEVDPIFLGYLFNGTLALNETFVNFVPYIGATSNINLGLFNITASWFKGLFNWVSGDDWNSFNGSTLIFNESKLSTVFYNVTSVQAVRGTEAGALSTIQIYDSISYNVTEVSGANGLDFRVNFTGVTDFNQIKIRYKSFSTESHLMYMQLYDIGLGTWENYYVFGSTPDYVNLAFTVDDTSDHLVGGVVQARFYQTDNGNVNHIHYFDWVVIADGYGTPSSQEIDPYSWHRNDEGETGNFTTTGNITVNYFFGNGSQLTGISSTETLWNANYTNFSNIYGYSLNSTGGGGGNPFDQSLNTTDQPSFDKLLITSDNSDNGNDVSPLRVLNYNPYTSQAIFGGLELQGFGLNNGWLADNVFYSQNVLNTGFNRRVDGTSNLIYFNGGNIGFYADGSDVAGVFTPTQRMILTSTGFLGLNTSTPQNLFNVLGDGNFTGDLFAGERNLSIGYDYATNGSLANTFTANYTNFSNIYGYALNSTNTFTGNYTNFSRIYEYAINGSGWVGNFTNFSNVYGYALNSSGISWATAYNGTLAKTDANNNFTQNQTFTTRYVDMVFPTIAPTSQGLRISRQGDNFDNALLLNYEGGTSTLNAMRNDTFNGYGNFYIKQSGNISGTFNSRTSMLFSYLGFVGINATSPQNTLNVVGDANITGNLYGGLIGEVKMYAGSTVPYGWFLTNGTNYSRTIYANLFAVIGTTYGNNSATDFKVPDTRGIFVSGAGTSGKLNNSNNIAFTRTLGTYQNDSMQGHLHSIPLGGQGPTTTGPGSWAGLFTSFNSYSPVTDGTNGAPRTGAETRPANIALNYIIKY